jgi:hypothetical protein
MVVQKTGDVHDVDYEIGSHDEVPKNAKKAKPPLNAPTDQWREVDVGDDGEWQDVGSGEEDAPLGSLPMVRSYSLEIDDCEDPVVLEEFNKQVQALHRRITGSKGPAVKTGKQPDAEAATKKRKSAGASAAGGASDKM